MNQGSVFTLKLRIKNIDHMVFINGPIFVIWIFWSQLLWLNFNESTFM